MLNGKAHSPTAPTSVIKDSALAVINLVIFILLFSFEGLSFVVPPSGGIGVTAETFRLKAGLHAFLSAVYFSAMREEYFPSVFGKARTVKGAVTLLSCKTSLAVTPAP